MSTTEAMQAIKARALDGLRFDIANLDDEETYDDVSYVYGYHLGRLSTLRDLGAMDDDEYDELTNELLCAIDEERDRRGE